MVEVWGGRVQGDRVPAAGSGEVIDCPVVFAAAGYDDLTAAAAG